MVKALIIDIRGSRSAKKSHRTKSPRKKAPKITSKNKDYFISKSVKHKGSFRRYCNAKGFRGASGNCIKHALKKGSEKRKKQANLARTLEKLQHRK